MTKKILKIKGEKGKWIRQKKFSDKLYIIKKMVQDVFDAIVIQKLYSEFMLDIVISWQNKFQKNAIFFEKSIISKLNRWTEFLVSERGYMEK